MPIVSRTSRRLLRHSALASASVLALLSSLPASADSSSSITVGSNNWLGGTDTDWFKSSNWWGGNIFVLPNPDFPVYFGPAQWIVNGVPTDTYDLPASEAVLRGIFSTSSLDMRAWDGISRIRLESGALLTAGSATVGGLHGVYQPTGPIQKATLVLAGGQIAGSWSFEAQSRVVVEGQYGLPSGNWSGTLGELQIQSGATLWLPAGTLAITQINNAGTMSLTAASNLTLSGTFQNAGTFTLGGSGNTGTAALYLSGDTTLAGAGSTVLTDANYSYVGGTGVLTVAQGHTLRGSGYVAVGMANQGTVIADGVFTVNAGAGNNFNNLAGQVQVADGGMLSLGGGTLSGGTLQGLGTDSRLGGYGTFKHVALSGPLLLTGSTTLDTVSNTGQLLLNGGNNVSTRGTLTNAGTLTLAGSGITGTAALYLDGDTTLAGSGSTVLTDANYSYVGGTGVLTVAQGHTLRGSGYVAVGMANQGTVIADGVLTVNAGTGSNFDNRGGLVQVANAGVLSLNSGTLSGGTLQGLGTDSRLGGYGTFQNVALQGTWLVAPGGGLTVAGTLTNTGTLTVGGSGNTGSAALYLAADTTLAGNGSTVLTDANYSYVGGTGVLTVTQGHTLRGSGYVAVGMANQGTVIADGVLTVNAGTGSNFDNRGGLVQVANAGVLSLNSGTLSGSTLQGLGTDSRLGGYGTFKHVALSGPLLLTGSTTLDTVSNTGQLLLNGGNNVSTRGTLTNAGTLTLAGSGITGTAALYLDGDTTLAGSGSTVLTDANYSYVGGTGVLTVAQGHTLRGSGYVAVGMANQGTVIADGVLTVNAGTGSNFDNRGGLVQVANAGVLSLNSGTLSGGTLQGLGTDSRLGGYGTFQNVALQGTWLVAPGGGLTVAGTLTNTGTLTVGGSGNTGSAALYLAADTTLAGNGSTVLTDANYSYVGGTGVLTVGQGHTLRGAGYLATGLTNQGRVQVGSGEVLQAAAGALRNQGQWLVDAEGTLDANNAPSGYLQDMASATTTVNGLLKAGSLRLEAGVLKGGGTVQANVLNLGGTINAGNSPGKLTIDGNLTLGTGSLLVVEVAGLQQGVQYDWLAVSGDVALDGGLQFDFGSYAPVIGETYSFLTSTSGHISGTFAKAFANGYALTLDYNAGGVNATVAAITAVPEPGTYAMMLAGLGLLGAAARRQTRGRASQASCTG